MAQSIIPTSMAAVTKPVKNAKGSKKKGNEMNKRKIPTRHWGQNQTKPISSIIILHKKLGGWRSQKSKLPVQTTFARFRTPP
ncbi:MAG: hypothetical protein WC840_02790 [Candidatus Peribacteraceae bacterium]